MFLSAGVWQTVYLPKLLQFDYSDLNNNNNFEYIIYVGRQHNVKLFPLIFV